MVFVVAKPVVIIMLMSQSGYLKLAYKCFKLDEHFKKARPAEFFLLHLKVI
jgi:hypothetical protein